MPCSQWPNGVSLVFFLIAAMELGISGKTDCRPYVLKSGIRLLSLINCCKLFALSCLYKVNTKNIVYASGCFRKTLNFAHPVKRGFWEITVKNKEGVNVMFPYHH